MPRFVVDLRDRLFRPQFPRRAEALAAVADAEFPQQAWENLVSHGLIPASWLSDPRRGFVGRPGRRTYRGRDTVMLRLWEFRDELHPVNPYPLTVHAAALIAAGAGEIEAAEELAREFARRLAPWDAPFAAAVPDRVVWQPWDPRDPPNYTQGEPLGLVDVSEIAEDAGAGAGVTDVDPAADAVPADDDPASRWYARRTAWRTDLGAAWHVVRGASLWPALASNDVRVPAERTRPPATYIPEHAQRRPRAVALAGARYADVANPFAPALGVFELGFSILGVTPDAIVLRVSVSSDTSP